MTTETIKTFKITQTGHLFCGQCLGFGKGGKIITGKPSEHLSDSDLKCDGCWKKRQDWPNA